MTDRRPQSPFGWAIHLSLWSVTLPPAMDNNNFLPFDLPAVARKKVTAAFDGGRLSSDGGVMLLRDRTVMNRLG